MVRPNVPVARDPPAVCRGPTVLLVEDQPDLRAALEFGFLQLGYAVVPAGSGDEALSAVATHDIDFAVIDMMIPGPSGFQVLRAVKDRVGAAAKAVMISGHGSAAHRAYAASLGADGFLVKPFPFAELFRVAEELCPPGGPPGAG